MTSPTTSKDPEFGERGADRGLTRSRTAHSANFRSLARRWRYQAMVSLAVVAIHGGMLVLLLQAGTGWRTHQDASSPDSGAMHVRFIAIDLTAVPTHAPPRPPPTSHPASAIKRATEHVPASRAAIAKPAREQPIGEPLQITVPSGDLPRSYVAGGARLTRDHGYDQQNVRVPGTMSPRGGPRFRMVDPRSQGLAVTAIRLLGSFTGAVDSHCVDLDTWQGMTVEERLADHVSQRDIDGAAAHGCRDPRPSVIPGPPVLR